MAEEFQVDAFRQFDKKWALLTAGKLDHYNTMTISWGGLGTLWGKPVATVYVKSIRHTWQFMNDNDYFTVSFYGEGYRKDLAVLGTKSGRDGDKVALTSLEAVAVEDSVSFRQAEVTLLCRKIYWQDLIRDNMPEDVIKEYYTPEDPHRMYIGEVVKIVHNG